MTGKQCRKKRLKLGWTQEQLAYNSRLAYATINRFEQGHTTPHRATIQMIEDALSQAGK